MTESSIIMSMGDRVISRELPNDERGIDSWAMSHPIPSEEIYIIHNIYRGIWLAVTYLNKQSKIYRSTNKRNFKLVHTINSKIYGIFGVSLGHALVCAEEGWWIATRAGLSWQATGWNNSPISSAAAIIRQPNNSYNIIAYGGDAKIYSRLYPDEDGEWIESYLHNTSSGRWYPALAGGPVGVLAAAGNKLIRLTVHSETWQEVAEFNGVIKQISISDQSEKPIFIITVDQLNSDKLYITEDLGDTIKFIKDVFDSATVISAVYPAGSGIKSTNFAVLGNKAEKYVYSTFEV